MKITRENCEQVRNFEHITLKNADGSRLRARRNGATRTWKRAPERYEIPVKHGMYNYFVITDLDTDWEGVE